MPVRQLGTGASSSETSGSYEREVDAGRGMGCMSSEALPRSDQLQGAEKVMKRLDKQIIGKSVLSSSR